MKSFAGRISLGIAWILSAPTVVYADSPYNKRVVQGRERHPDAAEKRLRVELKEILNAPELRNAFAGVHIRSLKDDHTIFDHNAGKLFNPASNMKLLTTAAALWHLGPSYRFKTIAKRDKVMKNGVLQGNLYIRGEGDPTLVTEELFGFVNEIALRGIRRVEGHLVLDDSFFDNVSEGPGWEQEHSDRAYAAPVGALSANFGTFTLRVFPNEARGRPAHVELWPPVPSIQVVNSAYTRGWKSRTRLWVGTTSDKDGKIRVTVRGGIGRDRTEGVIIRRRVHNPVLHAGEMILAMLKMRGVSVRRGIKFGQIPKNGVTYVATHWSRPLGELVSTLNKYSNNFIAEQILKTLGAELDEGPGSWASGNRAIRSFLLELGVKDGTFVIGNGSGLNDINRITPAQLTKLLSAMYHRFEVGPEFVASLAVAGNSGTIVGRFENSPAVSRLRAKTGSLTGVSALSGYVVTQNNDVLAFSVLMNDYPGRARRMWEIQDRIGIALARFKGTDVVARP